MGQTGETGNVARNLQSWTLAIESTAPSFTKHKQTTNDKVAICRMGRTYTVGLPGQDSTGKKVKKISFGELIRTSVQVTKQEDNLDGKMLSELQQRIKLISNIHDFRTGEGLKGFLIRLKERFSNLFKGYGFKTHTGLAESKIMQLSTQAVDTLAPLRSTAIQPPTAASTAAPAIPVNDDDVQNPFFSPIFAKVQEACAYASPDDVTAEAIQAAYPDLNLKDIPEQLNQYRQLTSGNTPAADGGKGITRDGQTCWLISSVQLLRAIPGIVEMLEQAPIPEGDKYRSISNKQHEQLRAVLIDIINRSNNSEVIPSRDISTLLVLLQPFSASIPRSKHRQFDCNEGVKIILGACNLELGQKKLISKTNGVHQQGELDESGILREIKLPTQSQVEEQEACAAMFEKLAECDRPSEGEQETFLRLFDLHKNAQLLEGCSFEQIGRSRDVRLKRDKPLPLQDLLIQAQNREQQCRILHRLSNLLKQYQEYQLSDKPPISDKPPKTIQEWFADQSTYYNNLISNRYAKKEDIPEEWSIVMNSKPLQNVLYDLHKEYVTEETTRDLPLPEGLSKEDASLTLQAAVKKYQDFVSSFESKQKRNQLIRPGIKDQKKQEKIQQQVQKMQRTPSFQDWLNDQLKPDEECLFAKTLKEGQPTQLKEHNFLRQRAITLVDKYGKNKIGSVENDMRSEKQLERFYKVIKPHLEGIAAVTKEATYNRTLEYTAAPNYMVCDIERTFTNRNQTVRNQTAINAFSPFTIQVYHNPENPKIRRDVDYQPTVVPIHQGGATGGHYTALRRHKDGTWHLYNDDHPPREISSEQLVNYQQFAKSVMAVRLN